MHFESNLSSWSSQGADWLIPSLVHKLSWCLRGDKPLFEEVIAQFNDAYMRPQPQCVKVMWHICIGEMVLHLGLNDILPHEQWFPVCCADVTDVTPLYLANWGQGKMATFSPTIFSSAFSWLKKYEFRSKCQWSLFLRVPLRIKLASIGTDNCLGPNRQQSTIWTNGGLVHWPIYTSLDPNELNAHLTIQDTFL